MTKNARISAEDVEKVSKLAKIKLSSQEIEKFTNDLSPALDVAQTFNDLDTTNIPIMSHATGTTNVLREDKVEESLNQTEVLKNAVKSENGFILIQRNSKK